MTVFRTSNRLLAKSSTIPGLLLLTPSIIITSLDVPEVATTIHPRKLVSTAAPPATSPKANCVIAVSLIRMLQERLLIVLPLSALLDTNATSDKRSLSVARMTKRMEPKHWTPEFFPKSAVSLSLKDGYNIHCSVAEGPRIV